MFIDYKSKVTFKEYNKENKLYVILFWAIPYKNTQTIRNIKISAGGKASN